MKKIHYTDYSEKNVPTGAKQVYTVSLDISYTTFILGLGHPAQTTWGQNVNSGMLDQYKICHFGTQHPHSHWKHCNGS